MAPSESDFELPENGSDPVDSDDATSVGEELEAVEQWFIHRGLPNLIDDYDALTDVFNRATPVLSILWLFSIFGAYGDDLEGWYQAFAALGAAAILGVIAVVVNRVRGRPAFAVPTRVGYTELAIFVVTPAIIPVILQTGGLGIFLIGLAGGVIELLVVWFLYGFGMGSIVRWAFIHLLRQLRSVLGLMIRSLPLLLLLTMFLFLNAELWQVASNFTTPLFLTATGGLLLVSLVFVVFRLPQELRESGNFTSADDINAIVNASSAPITKRSKSPSRAPELSRMDWVNVSMLAIFSIVVQIALVMLIVGLFYLLFGIVTVRRETIAQWTTAGEAENVHVVLPLELFGSKVPLTAELLKVTGFLMAFTALQFTVSALTDAAYRKEFLDDLTGDIREALAVRIVYLERLRNR